MSKTLITQACIIGALDAAVYRDKTGVKALRLEENRVIECDREIPLLMRSNAEKRYLDNPPKNEKELIKELRKWSDRHSLLKLVISAMDPIYSNDTRITCMEEAQVLLANPDCKTFVYSRLLGCPLAEQADLAQTLELSKNHKMLNALYQQLNTGKL